MILQITTGKVSFNLRVMLKDDCLKYIYVETKGGVERYVVRKYCLQFFSYGMVQLNFKNPVHFCCIKYFKIIY